MLSTKRRGASGDRLAGEQLLRDWDRLVARKSDINPALLSAQLGLFKSRVLCSGVRNVNLDERNLSSTLCKVRINYIKMLSFHMKHLYGSA